MPKKSNFPESTEYTPAESRPICAIETATGYEHLKEINIERVIGTYPVTFRGHTTTHSLIQIRTYENVRAKSLCRLHRVVSKFVNDGQATIDLHSHGYRIEL